MTPQIDCLGETSTVLRVSTHIYGVCKEIDGKMFIFQLNLGMWPLKSIVLKKQTLFWGFQHRFMGLTCLCIVYLMIITLLSSTAATQHKKTNRMVYTYKYNWHPPNWYIQKTSYPRGSLSLLLCKLIETEQVLVSIVKAHTIKCQIYPDEVFYAKDLLPTRVTI